MKIFFMILLLILEIINGICSFKSIDKYMKGIYYLITMECAIALFIIGALG